MADVWLKDSDTSPIVRAVLRDGADQPVNLSGAQGVRFLMRRQRGTGLVVDGNATVDQVGDGSDGTKGQVRYDWAEGEIVEPGGFLGEFEVTFADGDVETFPNDTYLKIAVLSDLEGTFTPVEPPIGPTDLIIAQHIAFGDATVDDPNLDVHPVGYPSASSGIATQLGLKIRVQNEYTTYTGAAGDTDSVIGLQSVAVGARTTPLTGGTYNPDHIGLVGGVNTEAGAQPIDTAFGVWGSVWGYAGASKIGSARAVWAEGNIGENMPAPDSFAAYSATYVEHATGAAITSTLRGVDLRATLSRVGTYTYTGVYVRAPAGAGSAGSDYGIYIEAQAKGTTANWNIYSAGATSKNKLEGRTFLGGPATAPADADLGNSQWTAWLNEAGNALTFRVRYANGTLKTGTLALT